MLFGKAWHIRLLAEGHLLARGHLRAERAEHPIKAVAMPGAQAKLQPGIGRPA